MRTALMKRATLTAVTLSATAATLAPLATAATSTPKAPNATARQHGIDARGQATMGWRAKPDVNAAPTTGTNPKATQLVNQLRIPGATPQANVLAAVQQTAGLDLSNYTQGERWDTWKKNGVRFVYIKASEGTYGGNKSFNRQYAGATNANVIRGGYHFANPNSSDGATQADFFINHGGGWSPDGKTLPGALDMEWNPYAGNMCYDKTPAQLQQFVADFVGRYKARTGTRPIIYTASIWWNKCMGSSPKWVSTPLWIADYHSKVGALPDAWSGVSHTMWQNAAYSSVGYDTDLFNGSETQLRRYALTGTR